MKNPIFNSKSNSDWYPASCTLHSELELQNPDQYENIPIHPKNCTYQARYLLIPRTVIIVRHYEELIHKDDINKRSSEAWVYIGYLMHWRIQLNKECAVNIANIILISVAPVTESIYFILAMPTTLRLCICLSSFSPLSVPWLSTFRKQHLRPSHPAWLFSCSSCSTGMKVNRSRVVVG